MGLSEAALRTHPAVPDILRLVQPRIKTLAGADAPEIIFAESIHHDPAAILVKGLDAQPTLATLGAAARIVTELPFEDSTLEPALRLWPTRSG